MSDPRTISTVQASSTLSRKATVVKVIRGTSSATDSPKPETPVPKPKSQVATVPESELEPIHKVVNQASRTQFRDFSERYTHSQAEPKIDKRLARGPHFPMATSLRFASLFYIVGRLSIVATLGSLVWFSLSGRSDYWMSAPLLAAAILFTFIAWGMSDGLRCRVCTMPFLGKRKCKMSQKAPKIPLLSHHFTAALHILAHNHPRCPYCGTTNRLKK